MVDYTTNFFDISLLPNKRSATFVTHTKKVFSMFRIPTNVISDNGPEYIENLRDSIANGNPALTNVFQGKEAWQII